MIAVLSSYIKNIAILTVFIAFIGIILPSGKYKSYIDVVLGLILIFVMLQPVTNWFSGRGNSYEDIFAEITSPLQGEDASNAGDYAPDIQNELVAKSFKSMIRKQVESLVSPHQFTVEAFDMTYAQDTGEIQMMTLEVSPSVVQNGKNALIRIEPVTVRTPKLKNTEQAQEDETEEETPEIKKLKIIVSDFYNLAEDNIHITVQKKNQGR